MDERTQGPVRLQKYLRECGVASRRKCELLISQGRVKVNGETVTRQGTTVGLNDKVLVDGKRLHYRSRRHYLMLNKPAGVLTSLSDPEGRPTVVDLLPNSNWTLFPVGRLDWSSEGLLLLTDDGELAHRVAHPSFRITKEYLAKIRGAIQPTDPVLSQVRDGVMLSDGLAKPSSVRVHRTTETSTWIFVTVSEGRNRLVRRIFEAVGLQVVRLKRTKLGSLELGYLPSRAHRYLTKRETRELLHSVGLSSASRSPDPPRTSRSKGSDSRPHKVRTVKRGRNPGPQK